MKQRQKDLTFLDLPPDALKKIKPKPTNTLSDKDRVAQTQHPTLDRKTLEELEAMRRAGPPAPAPALKQPAAQQAAQGSASAKPAASPSPSPCPSCSAPRR